MNSKLSKKVSDKIETLCRSGCTEITQLLQDAKEGNKIEALSGFGSIEINQIIDELSQIMSVYNPKNDVENDDMQDEDNNADKRDDKRIK